MSIFDARQWKTAVEQAIPEDIRDLNRVKPKSWDAVWRQIEDSDDNFIQNANTLEEGRQGEGLAYLLGRIEDKIGDFYAYEEHLSRGPRLPKHKGKPASPKESTREAPRDGRFQAMSEIVATLANREEDIRAFRQEILNGQLLKSEEVPQWIASMSEKEGRSLRFTFTVNDSEDWGEEVVRQAQACATAHKEDKFHPVGVNREKLLYVVPGSDIAGTALINANGTLGRLKRLAAIYQTIWPEQWAVHFILTSEAFPVSRATVGTKYDAAYGLHRITLEVSPHLTGDKVRDLYLSERQGFFSQHGFGRNTRTLTVKHVGLAVFAAKTPGPWPRKMRRWNQKFPQWKYAYASRFERDCRAAYRNVTGWEWDG